MPFYRILIIAGAALVAGCITIQITPVTSDIQDVHDAYRREFAQQFLPSAPKEAGNTPAERGFSETLEKIRQFQLKHPGRTTEIAHLTVLEGMIYVQQNMLSSAQLMKDDVVSAGGKLGSGDEYVARDRLFSENFQSLIDAGRIAANPNAAANSPAETEAKAKDVAQSLCKSLLDVGDSGALCGADASSTVQPRANNASSVGDGGPIYIAATSGLTYAWARHAAHFRCRDQNPSDSSARKECRDQVRVSYFEAAAGVLGRFLTEGERRVATDQGIQLDPKASAGRIRYMVMYRNFRQCFETETCAY